MSSAADSEGPGPDTGRKLRIHGSIARELGIEILCGRYEPGQYLAKETLASRRLEVSRTAYREAMRILAAKGLVESRPKTGTRITSRDRWHLLDPDVLQWVFEGNADERIIQGLFELRLVVEPAAAGFAASRRTLPQLRAMRRALDDMRLYGLAREAGQLADCAFHHLLLEATGNDVLIALASGITAAVRWTTVYKARVPQQPRDAIDEHERVYEAVHAAEPEAARAAMTRLVLAALADTQSTLARTDKSAARPSHLRVGKAPGKRTRPSRTRGAR